MQKYSNNLNQIFISKFHYVSHFCRIRCFLQFSIQSFAQILKIEIEHPLIAAYLLGYLEKKVFSHHILCRHQQRIYIFKSIEF